MMIDTHCHLDKDDYDNLENVIKKMQGNIMIASGSSSKTNANVIDLINKYRNIYGSIGIHPEEITEDFEQDFEYIEQNITNPKIVAIGEIGLDYYWNKENKEVQKDIFIRQIKLANKYNKPIVIHSRDAAEDTYNILKEYLNGNKATLHCYSYTLEMALRFIDLGVNFGIGGVITFKNALKIEEVVKNIDLGKFMLETDSPYLTPEPYRGQKNEPYNIIYVAKKIAEIKGISLEKVLEITTENAVKQFDLKF